MAVYEIGGECLTRTQHDMREFRKQIQERSNGVLSSAAGKSAGVNPVNPDNLLSQAVQGVSATSQTSISDTGTNGRILDITV